MFRPVPRSVRARILGSAVSLLVLAAAGAAIAQTAGTPQDRQQPTPPPAAGTIPPQQPPAGGGLIMPGQVQNAPTLRPAPGGPAAGTIAPRPQQAPQAAAPRPAAPTGAAPTAPAPAAPAAAVASGTPAAPKGDWVVAPQVFSDGTFRLCGAQNEFESGLVLAFLRSPQGAVEMLLGVPGAQLPPGRFKATVSIDDRLTRELDAITAQADAIAFRVGDDQEFLRGVAQGSVMRVQVPGDVAAFRLRGTTKALNDLSSCVEQALAGTLQLPQPPPMIDPRLAAVLAQAGLFNARPIPVDRMPPERRPGNFAWQIDDKVLGSVRQIPVPPQAGSLAQVSQAFVEELRKTCPGAFSPELQDVESVSGVEFRRGFITCEQPAAQDRKAETVHASMLMQLTPNRVLSVFLHEGLAEDRAIAEGASEGIGKVLRTLAEQAAANQPAAGQAASGQIAPGQQAPSPQ